jgi:hypothetical protein
VNIVESTVHLTPLKVGEWVGTLELIVIPLENNELILGRDFLRHAKATPIQHLHCLAFFESLRPCIFPLKVRNKLGPMSHISAMRLIQVDMEPMNEPYVVALQQVALGISQILLKRTKEGRCDNEALCGQGGIIYMEGKFDRLEYFVIYVLRETYSMVV